MMKRSTRVAFIKKKKVNIYDIDVNKMLVSKKNIMLKKLI